MASKPGRRKARRSGQIEAEHAAAAEPGATRQWRWLWFAILPAITALVYWPALRGEFVFDDYHLPFSDPNASTAGASFWIGGVRPALMATYWLNFVISGKHPMAYHIGNLLLHTVTTGLVFLLLKRLLELAGVESDRRLMALFGAGLFLLHPLQTESVAYVAGRSEEVAGLFFVSAWLVFVKNFESATTTITALEILLLAGIAVAGKESAISLPAILLLTDMYWNPASLMSQFRSRARLYVPIVSGGVLVADRILRTLTSGTGAGSGQSGVTPALYALTQCRVIPIYIRMFLFPVGQNGDWKLRFFTSLTDHAAWIYALVMVAFVALVVRTYRKARLFSFGLAAFLVMLMPTSSVIPIIDAVAERRMYIPIIGLILASIWLIVHFRPRLQILHRERNLRVAFVLFLIVEAGLSFERSQVWGSDILFWTNSLEGNPENTRALLGLGDAYVLQGKCADGVRVYRNLEHRVGATAEVESNLANAYQCNHQPDLALGILRALVARSPSTAKYAQIGYLEAASGHVDDALEAIRKSLELDPRNADAYAYRGVIQLVRGNQAEGTVDLRHALEIEPENAAAKYGIEILKGKR
jgi:hypothetical protein